jgi:hypothetical protein
MTEGYRANMEWVMRCISAIELNMYRPMSNPLQMDLVKVEDIIGAKTRRGATLAEKRKILIDWLDAVVARMDVSDPNSRSSQFVNRMRN